MGRSRFLNSANQRVRTLGNVGVVNVTAIRHIEGVVSTNIAAGPGAAIINGVPVSEPKGLARPQADGDRGPGHTRRAAKPTLRPRVRPVRPQVVAAGEGGPVRVTGRGAIFATWPVRNPQRDRPGYREYRLRAARRHGRWTVR